MSPHAKALLRRGRWQRAWRELLVAMRRAEQPHNDAYVMVFVLCAFAFMAGYGLAKHHTSLMNQIRGAAVASR